MGERGVEGQGGVLAGEGVEPALGDPGGDLFLCFYLFVMFGEGREDEFLNIEDEDGLWVVVMVEELEELFALLRYVVDVLDDDDDDGGVVCVEVMMEDLDDGDWLWGEDDFLNIDEEDGLWVVVMVQEVEEVLSFLQHSVPIFDDDDWLVHVELIIDKLEDDWVGDFSFFEKTLLSSLT